jgi:hypothetical protein
MIESVRNQFVGAHTRTKWSHTRAQGVVLGALCNGESDILFIPKEDEMSTKVTVFELMKLLLPFV